MIKIYGLKTCPYCDYVKAQIVGREDEFQYIDIGSHVKYMHQFIDMRDHRPEFDHSKEIGDIGIPAFVLPDGSITLDPAKVGLKEYDPNTPACSIDDHKNGKGGC
ncbi:MAG: glutaredoxin-related protein [Lachnospiraceae bacterium]|jgi:glutaredoxin-related protein|nr:glutaredoxin-related protein [Lachnospiraceae bacterium]MDD6578473.1 glutaredoxin-related protein [Lachnospiraceae bacterium]